MKSYRKRFCFLALALLFLPSLARAESEELQLIKDIEVHGFASSSYNYNFNEPSNRNNNLRVFDRDHNSFKFDVGELVLKKDAAKPGSIGFRTDLAYGFAIPKNTKSSPGPNVGGTAVANYDFDLQQGFVSYNAPVGNGIKLDFGKFITNMGAEVIEGYDAWNYNYSHSFLFGFAIPFTHTGLRAAYTINDQFSVQGMVANGWDNETDTNDGKLWHAQLAYAPLSNVSLVYNYMGGPEAQTGNAANDKNWRNLHDFVATIGLTDKLTLSLNVDHGNEEKASAITTGGNAEWWGFAGIVRHQCNKWFAVNLRGEYFDDPQAFRTGTKQELWEVTLTPEIRVNKNMVVRPEYRHDESDALAFGSKSGNVMEKTQDTIAVNALFFF